MLLLLLLLPGLLCVAADADGSGVAAKNRLTIQWSSLHSFVLFYS